VTCRHGTLAFVIHLTYQDALLKLGCLLFANHSASGVQIPGLRSIDETRSGDYARASRNPSRAVRPTAADFSARVGRNGINLAVSGTSTDTDFHHSVSLCGYADPILVVCVCTYSLLLFRLIASKEKVPRKCPRREFHRPSAGLLPQRSFWRIQMELPFGSHWKGSFTFELVTSLRQ
jgi:hypothetical protein